MVQRVFWNDGGSAGGREEVGSLFGMPIDICFRRGGARVDDFVQTAVSPVSVVIGLAEL
jgi:hypothetical protein